MTRRVARPIRGGADAILAVMLRTVPGHRCVITPRNAIHKPAAGEGSIVCTYLDNGDLVITYELNAPDERGPLGRFVDWWQS